jgi:hypothetical protein
MFFTLSRDGILGHQFNKRLKSFASFYSQSLLLKDFKEYCNPSLVERKNESRKPERTRVGEDSSLCPETSTKNAVQEFHLRLIVCECTAGAERSYFSHFVCIYSRGLQCFKLNGNQTDNDRYWQKYNFLLFAKCLKMNKKFWVIIALFAYFKCKCEKNCTFSNILQKIKSYFFGNIYQSPFDSY